MVQPFSPVTAAARAAAKRCRRAWWGLTCRSGADGVPQFRRLEALDFGALNVHGNDGVRFYTNENRHRTLAGNAAGDRRCVLHADAGLTGGFMQTERMTMARRWSGSLINSTSALMALKRPSWKAWRPFWSWQRAGHRPSAGTGAGPSAGNAGAVMNRASPTWRRDSPNSIAVSAFSP